MTPQPLIVTVAPNGARRTKADHPALPITPEELARTAADCVDAGAAMFHLHVRDPDGRHSLDAETYRRAIGAIRRAVGHRLIVQVTTEAAGRYATDRQMALVRDLQPEAVSLALREIVPDRSGEAAAAAFFGWLATAPIRPQIILYAADDLRRYLDLRRRGVIVGEGHTLLFVLGRYDDGQAAQPAEITTFLEAHDGATPWALCAFGPREHACCLAAAALDGHVRVGFENNLVLRDGHPAPDNAALVTQMRAGAEALGRPLADAADARAMLGFG